MGIEVETLDCGSEVADWFCQFCKKPPGSYRLRYHSEELKPRNLSIDPKEGDRFAANDIVSWRLSSSYERDDNSYALGDSGKTLALHANERSFSG